MYGVNSNLNYFGTYFLMIMHTYTIPFFISIMAHSPYLRRLWRGHKLKTEGKEQLRTEEKEQLKTEGKQ